jgi:putative spermidine/putrescine transport system permease protein
MSKKTAATLPKGLWHHASAIVTGLVLVFLILPILVVLPLSLNPGSFLSYPINGVSFRWFEELATNYKWILALKNSLIVGFGSAFLSVVFGLTAAIALNGMNGLPKRIIHAILVAPLVVPLIIMAVALFLFFSDLGLTGNLTGMILAHTVIGTPYVVIATSAALQNFDMTLIRAATSLGASPWRAYRQVMFPIIMPAIVAGGLFAFVNSFDEVVIVLFLSGPSQITLPIRLFDGIRDELTPVVIAAAVVMIAISVSLMGLVEYMRRRSVVSRGII